MDGSQKRLVPSESTGSPKSSTTGMNLHFLSVCSPKSSTTGSGENDENYPGEDKMIPKFQNQKKTVVKHFMSPTISAASKAAAPRKKILAERNENSITSDAQNQKMSNLDVEKSPRNSSIIHFDGSSSQIVSSYDHASEPDNYGDTSFLGDSSVKAYDPLTNYLSPRPKYLRFNPNRRSKIFSRLEKEGREALNSSFDSQEVNDEEESPAEEIKDTSFSPRKESVVKPKNEENTEEEDGNIIDDYEEEEEELEEDRGWCLRGVLKVLFTLVACLLSTSYICSMNSPTPSPTQHAIWNLKDGYLMIKKQTLEVITMKMCDAGWWEVEACENYGEVEEVEFCEDGIEATEESVEAEMVEDNVESLEGHDEELVGNENEDSEDRIDKDAEIKGVLAGEFEFTAENSEQLLGAKTDESVDVDAGSFCLEKEVESSYLVLKENAGDGEVEPEKKSFGQLIITKTAETEYAGGYVLETEVEGSNLLQELEVSLKSISEEESPQEYKVDGLESLEEPVGSPEKLADSGHEINEIGHDNEVETEKVGLRTSALRGVSVVSVILTSLAFIYRSKKARNTSAEESEPVLKPHKFAVEEKVTPVLPSMKRKIEFSARPSFLPHSMKEPLVELNNHNRAPTVELISEIVVGRVSSHRSYGRKYQMTESEEGNAALSTKHSSLPQPVYASVQPSTLENSTADSPSYGSFTSEKKMLKKQGGQSEEAMIEVTPVRRSSRLRNRAAATSP